MAFTNATTKVKAIDLTASLNRYLAEIQVLVSQNKLEEVPGKLRWVVRALDQFLRDNKLDSAVEDKVKGIKEKAEKFGASIGKMTPQSCRAMIQYLAKAVGELK